MLAAAGPSILRGSESFTLAARALDQTFLIEVAAPSRPEKPLPVIYALDGSFGHGMAAQIVSLLQQSRALPPVVLVSIGYPREVDAKTIRALRLRDFTPTANAELLAMLSKASPGEFPAQTVSGGAPAFLRFIQEELKPAIESRFAVDKADQTLAGMSLGGLFALHALFTEPTSFQRYIAASPSIWWDDRAILRQESEFAATGVAANLFLSIGALEEAEHGAARMVSNVYELDARLRGRKIPGLRLAFDVFGGETHNSVYPAALSRGLRTVFGTMPGFEAWATLSAGGHAA